MENPGRRLTVQEIEQRRAHLREWYEARDSDPEFLQMRAWLQGAFDSDYEKICGFAARLVISEGRLAKENEELVNRLNRTHGIAKALSQSSEIEGYVKKNIARMALDNDFEEPAALAFISGLSVSKALQASLGGRKRSEKIQLVKVLALQLFDAGNWKSTKQARAAIWPKVKAEARRVGWEITEETGPETLYKWLLAHSKQRLQANA